jgi:hypothetical protein
MSGRFPEFGAWDGVGRKVAAAGAIAAALLGLVEGLVGGRE